MATQSNRLRVLLAKTNMDHHDRGIRYIARVLREAGTEVIFIRYRLPEEVVQVAMQEGVDVIGLSFYGYGAIYDTSVVMSKLKEQQMEDIPVIAGGIFPEDDAAELRAMGVQAIFGPGTPTGEVIDWLNSQAVQQLSEK